MSQVVPLGVDDAQEVWALGRLAFGGDPAGAPPSGPRPYDRWGVRDDRRRLVAVASLFDYHQWWGGREVPMGGVAGVAVHPDARGTGLARRLLDHLVEVMGQRGQPVSALFPTVPGLYRSLGWETVGALDDTRIATRDLAPLEPVRECTVRSGEPGADGAAVQRLYDDWARAGAGGLTRRGPMFAGGPDEAFDGDVVALAVGPDGEVRGYCSYDRGRGYHAGEGELRVWELVAAEADAARALLASLAGWHPVAATTLWRGPRQDLGLLTATAAPTATGTRPWMLRLVDPAAAVAARGFLPEVDVGADVVLVGAGPERAWRLEVGSGHGTLQPGTEDGAPRLHVRGLALLYAGAATTAVLQRTGLLDRPAPALDAAFAGPAPALLDYF